MSRSCRRRHQWGGANFNLADMIAAGRLRSIREHQASVSAIPASQEKRVESSLIGGARAGVAWDPSGGTSSPPRLYALRTFNSGQRT
jgi:hypothetical protein